MATVTGTKRLLDITGDNITTAVSLEAEGTLLDSNGTSGTSGQLLSSTGTGVDWVSNNSGSWDGIYSGSAQITGSLGVTGSIESLTNEGFNIWQIGVPEIKNFDTDENWGLTLGPEEGLVFTNGTGDNTGKSIYGPNSIGLIGTYFQTDGSGGDLWEVHDTDVGIRTKIVSDGLGDDNSFWQKGGSNTSYSHMIGYEFGDTNRLLIGVDNCDGIQIGSGGSGSAVLSNGGLAVIASPATSPPNTSKISLGGNSIDNATTTGVTFQYSGSKFNIVENSSTEPIFEFDNAGNEIVIKIGDFPGLINETYIEINDTDSKVVIPNGLVGIGTTTPDAKLHVQGTTLPQAKIGYDANNYVQVSVNGSGDTTIAPTGGGVVAPDLTLSAGSAYVKLDAQTNNVGIGTTSPATTLDLLGDYRQTYSPVPAAGGTAIARTLSYSVSPYGLVTRAYSNGLYSIQNEREANAGETFDLSLQPTGGDVGIGTLAPGTKLDINSGTANSALRVLSTDRYTGIKFEDSINSDTLFYDGQDGLMYLGST
ncbi:hypothetical protein N9P57_03055, partial [Planktomarina temperata]|nr:hypothetical protein [Planktomarina temperata]